jgi:hypothetical protein
VEVGQLSAKTVNGNTIDCIVLSETTSKFSDRKTVLVVGGQRADPLSVSTAMNTIENLITLYEDNDSEIVWLLKTSEVIVVP